MEGIKFVDEILAGEGGGFTANELRYTCGSALAITTFYNDDGRPPC